jgi:hypothetical protein
MPEPTKPLLGQFLPAVRAARVVNYASKNKGLSAMGAAKAVDYARKLIPPLVKKANQTYTDVLVGRNQSAEALTLKGITGGAYEAKRKKKVTEKK